jgi:2-dehydro-3-deoxy-D-gluconate 5-dehydrogenase
MQNLFDLSGKKAIVTGCRNGIGQGMAFALVGSGADIISFDRNDPVETREYVESLGRKFFWTRIDLLAATGAQLQEAVDRVAKELPIDILVNNAGICPRAGIEEHPGQMWEETIKLNLSTVWYLSQAVSRHMIVQGGGKIIIIGSVLTFQGGLNVPGYAASKHGIAGLAKSLTNGLADKNINVNVLAPGYIETKLTQSIQDDKERNKSILERIPAKRWGTPDDLGGPCVFLASRASDYINGTVISVDGGWMSR